MVNKWEFSHLEILIENTVQTGKWLGLLSKQKAETAW